MKVLAIVLLALGMLAGCNSGNSSKESSDNAGTPAPQPVDKETGRVAFQKMYIQARGWAADALPFSEESQPTQDASGKGGASAVWRARFGSRIRATAKAFVWSGTDAADAPARGITPSSEDTFSPTNTSTQTFDLGFLKTDSDKAFAVAQEHGGKKLLEKTPNLPVQYQLGFDPRSNTLIWHVNYGDGKLLVDVNASSGAFIRVEK